MILNWMKEANKLWNWITNGSQDVDSMKRELSVKLEYLYKQGYRAGFQEGKKQK